jgi:site-specific DNA-methyltransferase (adenine-specific)
MDQNLLFYGDNLDVLRRYIKDETVDLVYLDPPFNSNASYNVLFAEQDGSQAASQIRAFEDTWTWGTESEEVFADIVTAGGRVSDCLQAFRTFLGECNMLAYLVMMAPRLVELHRVLKLTGSIYLHCDPTASHYLKMLMDAVFGAVNYRNEISWVRSQPKSHTTISLPNSRDIILRFSKTDSIVFNKVYTDYDTDYVEKFYRHRDKDGRRYQLDNLLNPNKDRPNLTYEFLGVTRVWRWTKERMQKAYEDGRIHQSRPGSVPRYKRYLDEMPGRPITDSWSDVEHLHGSSSESLGYPTQKPVALLERIIQASSNEGDIVLDPFCGCGTTIAAAEKLNRRWIGIDITHLAINLIKNRLLDAHGDIPYEVIGEPTSLAGAAALAAEDPYQFQWWALGLVGARPAEQKKGADKGIDGKIIFQGDTKGQFEKVIISVKAGKTGSAHVRDLKGVLDREEAAIGVLISLQDPTGPMKKEAATSGFYESKTWGQRYPKVQLLTIEDLLEGRGIEMPPIKQVSRTFKRAPKSKRKGPETESLLD